MSSFVNAGVRSVAGKITRLGLEMRTSRPPASTKASSAKGSLRKRDARPACAHVVGARLGGRRDRGRGRAEPRRGRGHGRAVLIDEALAGAVVRVRRGLE